MATELFRLEELLPVLYRDGAADPPVVELVRIIERQARRLDTDIDRLWDNLFIETCDPWVVPYLGDLVANRLLYPVDPAKDAATARRLFTELAGPSLAPPAGVRLRSDVANTIAYRRRKGTLAMLEALARDVTGWPAHAVEFLRQLEWTQHLEHLRPESTECADLRRPADAGLYHGPFDPAAHTVDVRAIASLEGWYNIKNVGLFLWRLRSFPIITTARRHAEAWQYRFSPLGDDAPMFAQALTPDEDRPEGPFTVEHDLPGPIRPAALWDDLRKTAGAVSSYYGDPALSETTSIAIWRAGAAVPAVDVLCADLSLWDLPGFARPPGLKVAVDPVRGRLAFGVGWPARRADVRVWHCFGFSSAMGGGSYERAGWLVRRGGALELRVGKAGGPGVFPRVADALNEWVVQGRPDCVIGIEDSLTYDEPALVVDLPDAHWLAIEAVDRQRPHLRIEGQLLRVTGVAPEGRLNLSGLLIEGAVALDGDLGTLRIHHCTLVPGRALEPDGYADVTDPAALPAIVVAGLDAAGAEINRALRLEVAWSIVGPIRIPRDATGLWLLDSIVDGVATPAGTRAVPAIADPDDPELYAAPGVLERTTVLGSSHFREADASECIFTETVRVERRQRGCFRFSYVLLASVTPRRYRCQPDFEIRVETERRRAAELLAGHLPPFPWEAGLPAEIAAWLVPAFTAGRYGHPGYAQLSQVCPRQIRQGGEEESEMGAFNHLRQPQREANLRMRLDEYLPVGLSAGLIFVT